MRLPREKATAEKAATGKAGAAPRGRRPYEKPGFAISIAFERQALACSGQLNFSPAPPSFCTLKS